MALLWLLKCGPCLLNIHGKTNKAHGELVFYLFSYVKGGKKEELVSLFNHFLPADQLK